jgi:hypothetical protein
MAGLVQVVQWIWAFSVAAQVVVCAMLFFRGHFRKLPVFTAFIALNICQAVFLYLVYTRFGFGSHSAKTLAWWSEAGTLFLRTLATTEVLRLVLSPYNGIWGLGWRVLAVAFVAVFSYSAIRAGSDANWAIVLADRGFHLAFAVACLLLLRYYTIPVYPACKALLAGFCIYSCTVVLANTVGRTLFQHEFKRYQPI